MPTKSTNNKALAQCREQFVESAGPIHELIPAGFLLDKKHPANDRYLKTLEHHQRMIVSLSSQMPPKHLIIIKRRLAGEQSNHIAQAIGLTSNTVSKVCNSEIGQRLTAMLKFYQLGVEGPNTAQRKNMLWRIATENEFMQPRVSIAAVEGLNRMENDDFSRKNPQLTGAAPVQTTVIINQALLPKTVLDA